MLPDIYIYLFLRKLFFIAEDYSTLIKMSRQGFLRFTIPQIYGVAADWITGNVYFNEARSRIKINTSDRKTGFNILVYQAEEESSIHSIAIDPVAGYWLILKT